MEKLNKISESQEPPQKLPENIGVYDTIEIEGREFHITTGTLLEDRRIITEVFERGMFLISREYSLDLRSETKQLNYDFLNYVTQEFHYRVIEELEALYTIETKLSRYRHPKSFYHLGLLFLKRNLYPEAIRQFEKAIQFDKRYLEAYMGLGVSYLKSRQFDEALRTFQNTLNFNERYPDLLNFFGLAYLFKGDYERSMSLFKEAIQLNPNYIECQFNFGVALYKSALDGVKDPRAVAVPARVSIYLKQVRDLEKYKSESWQKQFNQVLDLLKDNNHEIIIPQLEELQLRLVDVVTDKEKKFEFYLRFLFGGKEMDLETIEKYEPYFVNGVGKTNRYPDFWNDLGTFNLIKSRALYLKAMSDFERALDLASDYDEARKNLEKIKSNEKGFLILLRAILK